MMARNKPFPRGADGNLSSWMGRGINPQTQENIYIAKLSSSGVETDLYHNRREVEGVLGKKVVDDYVKARYDWLFDDLQQFTSISADSIESKEDLKRFVEETIGKSVGFLSMKESAPRRYQSSINRATNSLWLKGHVEGVARINVVEPVSEERVEIVAQRIKKDKSRRRALSDARFGNLYLVRREQLVAKRIDKRGRRFFINLMTGRRARDPDRLLKELGFSQ